MTNYFVKTPQFLWNWGVFWFLFFSNQSLLFAQMEDSYWPLPDSFAIKWVTPDSFVITNSGFFSLAIEGASSICDKFGNLLYYSDGKKLFNSNHNVLDTNFLACSWSINSGNYCSSTQGCLFLNSSEDSLIHFITTESVNNNGAFYTKLNKNNSILYQNKQILQNSSELLNAVRHANGRDWWFFLHGLNDDIYHCFLINDDSVNYVKSIKIGSIFSGNFQYVGNLAISKKGDLIAKVSIASQGMSNCILDVFNFERNNCSFLYKNDLNYICEDASDNRMYYSTFSNEGKYLYISTEQNSSLIIIDLNNFKITKKFIWRITNFKLYNGKIFIGRGTVPSAIDMISDTDTLLLDSTNYKAGLINFETQNNFFTLPNHPNYSLGPDLHPGFTYTLNSNCPKNTITVTDTSWGHFYRVWDWGDGSPKDTFDVVQHAEYLPGLLDTFKTVSHTYSQPGTYTVTLQILNPYTPYKLPAGQFLKDTLEQLVLIPDCIYPQASLSDSSICPNKAVEIKYLGSKNYQSLTMFYGDGISETKNYPDSVFMHTYSQSGTYSLLLQASNADIDTLHPVGEIQVLECPDYLYVYPNPVTENLTIHYKQSTDFELVLYNSIGQSVWTKSVLAGEKSEQYELDLAAGVYVLRVNVLTPNASNGRELLKVMKLVKL